MFPTRVIVLCALALFCFSSALAQRPGPQFWRKSTANRSSHERDSKSSIVQGEVNH